MTVNAADTWTGVVLDALDMLQALARSNDDPADALQTIDVMLDSLRDGLAGKVSPEVVLAELKAVNEIAARERRDRQQRGAALHEKFDPSDS